MKRVASLVVGLVAGAFQIHAAPAETPPLRVHGMIKAFDGQYLTIAADSGKTIVLGLQPGTRIVHSRALALADLKPGFFVGTLARMSADGTLRAQAIRLFSPAAVGTGEGQYPDETNPTRIVTNATVSVVAPSPTGGILALTFHGAGGDPCKGRAPVGEAGCSGTAQLIVAHGVPILTLSDGDASLLRHGAIILAYATTDMTSLHTATRITVERDGKGAPIQSE